MFVKVYISLKLTYEPENVANFIVSNFIEIF